jgi:hypothetical protein
MADLTSGLQRNLTAKQFARECGLLLQLLHNRYISVSLWTFPLVAGARRGT